MRDFLYMRLVRALLAELASGLYAEDRRFLSNRKVRRLWKVAWATAASSLTWLVDKKLLVVKPRSGYYVAPQAQREALLLLHSRTLPGLPSPLSWDLKRFTLLANPSRSGRRFAVILTGGESSPAVLNSLPGHDLAADLGLESGRAIFQEAIRRDCSVQFYLDNGQAERRRMIVNHLLQQQPDGVIAFRRLPSYAALKPMIAPIVDAAIPVVTVFDDCEGLNLASVNINTVRLGYDVTRRFLRLGHRRIAILLPRLSSYFLDRAEGARMAMREVAAARGDLSILSFSPFRPIPASVARIFRDPERRPTALFVTSASLFASLWPLLRQSKLRVPRDLSIIMVAGITYLPECKRSFDTMRIDFPAIGKLAVHSLLGLWAGKLEQRTILVVPRYVRMGSVGRCP